MRNQPCGMTLAEVAVVLGISIASVYEAEKNALRKLKARPEAMALLSALAGELDGHRYDENSLMLPRRRRL